MINTSELGEISIGYKYLSSIENRPKITDAKGSITYEAELKGKDLIFDSKGKFIKETKD
jgi:hypothetical protein